MNDLRIGPAEMSVLTAGPYLRGHVSRQRAEERSADYSEVSLRFPWNSALSISPLAKRSFKVSMARGQSHAPRASRRAALFDHHSTWSILNFDIHFAREANDHLVLLGRSINRDGPECGAFDLCMAGPRFVPIAPKAPVSRS
jgi:hypothetical protein